ncbi:2-hydroxyacid dehydrogenase [Rhodocollybia butyracea]|uniref:2-hydroxyacid dehydrogenase n=1 Tax=Rhodocollybia butyracea TaxID=206335 RepID=A0A9P5TUC0_9AGAR|nr:2-hydroxyacid dehydrogenase [Rhodocollybia butyracea]
MAPKVLICGAIQTEQLFWADDDVKQLLGPIAEYFDSTDRTDFLKGFQPGEKYEGTVAMFRDNNLTDKIGIFDKELVDAFPSSVKWIAHQRRTKHAKAKEYPFTLVIGIIVSNTPGAVDDASATTALYLLISTFRNYAISEPQWTSSKIHDLTGHTLAILGLGGIGMRLADLAHAFPMRIIYHSRNKVADAPEWCEYFENVEEMLGQADVLSVHVPLRPDTVHLKGAIIINTARGKVIDEEAMIRALEDGHLASIGLDVYPNEPEVNPKLLEFPYITLLPHMGTENQDTQRKMEVRALKNVQEYLTIGSGKGYCTGVPKV